MRKHFPLILKNLLVLISMMAAFAVGSKVLNDAGNMPRFMRDAYKSSIFIQTGTKTPAIIGLCTLIALFLLANFQAVKDGLHHNRIMKGLIYGWTFGIVWFFGFTEMIVINHSENVAGHLRSGLRDFLCLSVFGLMAGILLCKGSDVRTTRKPKTFIAIPVVAVIFAAFHGAQYYFTFQSVAAYQRISDWKDVLWLLAFGAWLGLMYVLFRPGIHFRNRYLGALFFSFSVFGTDWLLYNLFYNIFLDIPLWDLFLRCLTGCAGLFAGLVLFELLVASEQ